MAKQISFSQIQQFTSQKTGKPYWKVLTNENPQRSGVCFFEPQPNIMVEVDEKQDSQNPNNWTWFKPNAAGSGFGGRKSGGSFAPSAATTKGKALEEAGKLCEKVQGAVTADNVLTLAKKFYAWLKDDDAPAAPAQVPTSPRPQAPPPPVPPAPQQSDDLPY